MCNFFFHQLVCVCAVVNTVCQEDPRSSLRTQKKNVVDLAMASECRGPTRMNATSPTYPHCLFPTSTPASHKCASADEDEPSAWIIRGRDFGPQVSLPCVAGFGSCEPECDRFLLWSRASHRLLYRPHNSKQRSPAMTFNGPPADENKRCRRHRADRDSKTSVSWDSSRKLPVSG